MRANFVNCFRDRTSNADPIYVAPGSKRGDLRGYSAGLQSSEHRPMYFQQFSCARGCALPYLGGFAGLAEVLELIN
jgi:hypothetical protein